MAMQFCCINCIALQYNYGVVVYKYKESFHPHTRVTWLASEFTPIKREGIPIYC